MMAYAVLLLVVVAGLAVGLIVGAARKHGLVWTFIDMVIAGVAALAFILFWLYGLGAIPGVVRTIDSVGRQYPVIGSAITIVTLATPLVGALIGVWLVSLLRPRRTPQAA